MTDMNEHKYDQGQSTQTTDPAKRNPSQQTGQNVQNDSQEKNPKNEGGRSTNQPDPAKKDASHVDNTRQQERERAQQGEKRRA